MFSRITAASGSPRSVVTVVGVTSDGRTVPAAHAKVAAVEAALETPGFNGDNGEVLAAGPRHVLLGLGASDAVTPATVRTAAAKLVKALDRRKDKAVTVDLSAGFPKKRAEVEALGRAFGEGLAIANWRVDGFDGAVSKRQPRGGALAVDAGDADFHDGLKRGLLLGGAVNYAREIGATPPNVCNPGWVAARARALAKETGLKCEVIDHARARKLGMGGLVTVGHGSDSKSCLIHLSHVPRRRTRGARGKRLVLVGKTLTYDTGGYSLKVNNGMKGMKYDKMGGCAVIGAMKAIAELGLGIEVHALLAAAENMVSGDSMRPDDIITMYNGATVEITNTDAEGRLVLADALTYAEEDLEATAIVDVATLTGGVVVALGHFCAGWFCNDDALVRSIEAASDASGERLWRLPLWKEHRDFMRGQHADLINSNPARSAHPIQGAAFLSHFVGEKTPWAHIDIAGVGNVDGANDLCVAGPTGWGVRLLVDWVEGESR
jgi:leucyl aminopeptidase